MVFFTHDIVWSIHSPSARIYLWNYLVHYQKHQVVVSVFVVDLGTYMTRFQWDMAKYPIKQSLRNISDIIAKVSYMMVFKVKEGPQFFQSKPVLKRFCMHRPI